MLADIMPHLYFSEMVKFFAENAKVDTHFSMGEIEVMYDKAKVLDFLELDLEVWFLTVAADFSGPIHLLHGSFRLLQ